MRTLLLKAFMFSLVEPPGTCAQSTFQKAYGGPGSDGAGRIVRTIDSAFVCAGSTQHPVFGNGDLWIYDMDMYLMKTTVEGDIIWTRRIGHPSLAEQANSVVQTTDGGFILCGGRIVSGNDREMLLVKTDSLGQVTWAKGAGRPGYDYARQVQQTSDGGYIIVGSHTDTINGGSICVLKFDSEGDTLWTRAFKSPGGGFDTGNSILQDFAGDYVITGQVGGSPSASLYFMKLSGNGTIAWAKNFEGSNDGQSVCQTQDGGYAVLGTYYHSTSKLDYYLIRANAAGDTLWTTTYGNPGWEFSRCVMESQDGGFILSGMTRASLVADDDACIIRTDSLGDPLGSWSYGTGGDDWVNSALEMSDGGVIASGTTYGAGLGSYELYSLRTDGSGSTGCNEQVLPVVRSTPPAIISDIQFEVTSGFTITELSLTSTPFGSMAPICLSTTTQETPVDHTVLVYPNPASDWITIRTSGDSGIWSYEITDLNGRVLIRNSSGISSNSRIPIDGLAPGAYLVRSSQAGYTYINKIVVHPLIR